MAASARLAVDIGGTFTDLALEHAGDRTTLKVLTTPANPAQGVQSALADELASNGISGADLGTVVHGTTLVTNAIVERKGTPTALLTTAGATVAQDSLPVAVLEPGRYTLSATIKPGGAKPFTRGFTVQAAPAANP